MSDTPESVVLTNYELVAAISVAYTGYRNSTGRENALWDRHLSALLAIQEKRAAPAAIGAEPVLWPSLVGALTELVACKDLKDAIDRSPPGDLDAVNNKLDDLDEYRRRKTAAWDAARTILSAIPK